MSTSDEAQASRSTLMRSCAFASDAELAAAVSALGPLPPVAELRAPEVGLAMLRGRIGGDGAPFNVGEATVTRAAVRLESGETGLSYLLGRRPEAARVAALIDALGQCAEWRPRLQSALVEPVSARIARERAEQRAATAATRVDFFTLVRGEDAA